MLRAAVATYALGVLVAAWLLPDTVPLHFSASGTADRYGSRTEALVLFTILGLLLLAVLAGSRWATQRGGLALVNVPHPDYWKTPEREPELRRRLRADLDQVFAATFLLGTAMVAATTWVARSEDQDRLPWAFLAAFAAYLLWTAWWGWHLAARRYRPPRC